MLWRIKCKTCVRNGSSLIYRHPAPAPQLSQLQRHPGNVALTGTIRPIGSDDAILRVEGLSHRDAVPRNLYGDFRHHETPEPHQAVSVLIPTITPLLRTLNDRVGASRYPGRNGETIRHRPNEVHIETALTATQRTCALEVAPGGHNARQQRERDTAANRAGALSRARESRCRTPLLRRRVHQLPHEQNRARELLADHKHEGTVDDQRRRAR